MISSSDKLSSGKEITGMEQRTIDDGQYYTFKFCTGCVGIFCYMPVKIHNLLYSQGLIL